MYIDDILVRGTLIQEHNEWSKAGMNLNLLNCQFEIQEEGFCSGIYSVEEVPGLSLVFSRLP